MEFTARFGYNAVYAALHQLPDFGTFLSDIALGRTPKIKSSKDYSAAVRVSIPPYPQDTDASKTAGRPIAGIKPPMNDIFLLDAQYKDRLVTAGVDGVVCEVTAKAPDLAALEKDVYAKVDKIKIPDKQYRSDGVKIAIQRIQQLKELDQYWIQ